MKLLVPGAGGKPLHIAAFQDVPEIEAVVVTEVHPWAYGTFVADRSFILPTFADPDFLTKMIEVYRRERCDVCVPIHDGALALLSRHREWLAAEGVRLAMNDRHTVDVASDKWAVHSFFVEHGVPTPETWLLEDFAARPSSTFPAFVKPRFIDMRGTSESLYLRLDDRDDVAYVTRKVRGRGDRYVVQPFIAGAETNIDFFCDDHGKVKSVVALQRLAATASGGIARGEIVSNERFLPSVRDITEHLRFWGANQLQAFVTADDVTLFTEINARFSGSSVFVRAAGVDDFKYFVQLLRGVPIDIDERPTPLLMSTWDSPFFYTRPPATPL